MAAIDVVNRVFREFKRYTGDGLPGEPANAPLPVGDPASGVYSPKKSELREALLAPIEDAGDSAAAAAASAVEAGGHADDSEAAAAIAVAAAAGVEFPVSYAPQTLTSEQRAQARENIGVSVGGELFSTVAALLADNEVVLGYASSGAEVEADVGFVFHAQGFRYEVAADDATDEHIETAGAVKLYVLPGADGKHYAQAWGVTNDDTGANDVILNDIREKLCAGFGSHEDRAHLTIVLPAGVVRVTNTFFFKQWGVGLEGAGRGGQTYIKFVNAAGGTVFAGDEDGTASLLTYSGCFIRDLEVTSGASDGATDATYVLNLTSFSYSYFNFRAQSKRPNAVLIYGVGNNGASPYYNRIESEGLFGGLDMTQRCFLFESGAWAGGSPGPNANFIGPITEAVLFNRFAEIKTGQGNHFSNIGIESIKDAYFLLGGNTFSHSGTSTGSNTLVSLNDSGAAFPTTGLKLVDGTVRIVSGTGSGQIRKIKDNSASTITLHDPWAVIPDATSTYEVYLVKCLGNKFSHIRGEDQASENPEFIRALYDADKFSFDSWYADSLGSGSYFEDHTGSQVNRVFGNKCITTYTFKAPGANVTVAAWGRNGAEGGLVLPAQTVLEWVRITKSKSAAVAAATVRVDIGGASASAGSPALVTSLAASQLQAMILPTAAQKTVFRSADTPIHLTLITNASFDAACDVTVAICTSQFDM